MASLTDDRRARIEPWQDLARQLRVDSIRCSTAAGSGHPTSALSAADLVAVLIADHLRYDFDRPRDAANDHLVFSKGHASPLIYAMFKAVGAITDDEMMTFRKQGSRLQGHPTPIIPWVDVATGSLGQGLPIAVGIALAASKLDQSPSRVWVMHGDSEMAEGSVWEGFEKAAHYGLGNLIAVVDMNRLGQRGETAVGWNGEVYAQRARAFGWRATVIDGHDLGAIDAAYREATADATRPMVIIAKTMKGRGAMVAENQDNWHGKALPPAEADKAIAALGGASHTVIKVAKPPVMSARTIRRAPTVLPKYEVGKEVATRWAYGEALRALGDARGDVVVVDAEVSNSTYAEFFQKKHPERFFEMFIAEQQMIATAVGLQVRGYVPFASTFAAFLTRAYDFVRMAAISRANLRMCGSHAGVSIGEDGPSQMALEDMAMMRAVHGSTVLYPSDPNQAAQLVAAMADLRGISYLRSTREKLPTLYHADHAFPIGGSHVARSSNADQATVVAAGITLHEALAAADRLAKAGIGARVVDAYSVKPLDANGVGAAVAATAGRLVVVEDHFAEGGLGSAVLEGLADIGRSPRAWRHLAVRQMPGSGTPRQNLAAAGIDAEAIVRAVTEIVRA